MPSLFSWLNAIDDAVLSAASPTATLPVSNLSDRRVQKVWRAPGITTWFGADFLVQKEIDVIGLFGCTLAATDTIRIRLSNTAIGDGDLLDTGTVNSGVLDGYGQYLKILDATITARYMRIDIDAQSRTGVGSFDIGRAWAGPGFVPAIGYSPGPGVSWNDDSTVIPSPRSGAIFVDPTPVYRSREITFDWLTEDEVDQIADMDRLTGKGQQLLFVADTASDLARNPILGRQGELHPFAEQEVVSPRAFSRQFSLVQDL